MHICREYYLSNSFSNCFKNLFTYNMDFWNWTYSKRVSQMTGTLIISLSEDVLLTQHITISDLMEALENYLIFLHTLLGFLYGKSFIQPFKS